MQVGGKKRNYNVLSKSWVSVLDKLGALDDGVRKKI